MMDFKIGTAINCIDGIDMVTFPGVDGVISNGENSDEIAFIRNAVSISIEKHRSRIIAVVGHFDCAGNPGNREHHYAHIQRAVHEVSSWSFHAQVVGFYVNNKKQIEEVK